MAPVSFLDRVIAHDRCRVQMFSAKDSTGRRACYYVHVPASKEQAFRQAMDSEGMIDLEDYGTVIASNYGDAPNEETKTILKERFGFEF